MILRLLSRCPQGFAKLQLRQYSSSQAASTPLTSPFSPRHLLSCEDLSKRDLTAIIRNAYKFKQSMKAGVVPQSLEGSLAGKTIAMMFNKRSTRTRVSSESAIATMGGHAMFLGKDDIQLGVNETVRDSSIVISSMVAAMVARVAAHNDIRDLAKYSTVPVINALSDDFHPLQAITDCLTLYETFGDIHGTKPVLGLEGLQLAWVGDSNNVLYDLAIAARKIGMHLNHAAPSGYEIPTRMLANIQTPSHQETTNGKLLRTNSPEEAIKGADVIFTDTWISMGWESETQERLKAFEGFQITEELAARGRAKEGWKFMHCLPRHPEEVSDEVFYHPQRSLVFTEAENRLYAMIAVLQAFVVHRGRLPVHTKALKCGSSTVDN